MTVTARSVVVPCYQCGGEHRRPRQDEASRTRFGLGESDYPNDSCPLWVAAHASYMAALRASWEPWPGDGTACDVAAYRARAADVQSRLEAAWREQQFVSTAALRCQRCWPMSGAGADGLWRVDDPGRCAWCRDVRARSLQELGYDITDNLARRSSDDRVHPLRPRIGLVRLSMLRARERAGVALLAAGDELDTALLDVEAALRLSPAWRERLGRLTCDNAEQSDAWMIRARCAFFLRSAEEQVTRAIAHRDACLDAYVAAHRVAQLVGAIACDDDCEACT